MGSKFVPSFLRNTAVVCIASAIVGSLAIIAPAFVDRHEADEKYVNKEILCYPVSSALTVCAAALVDGLISHYVGAHLPLPSDSLDSLEDENRRYASESDQHKDFLERTHATDSDNCSQSLNYNNSKGRRVRIEQESSEAKHQSNNEISSDIENGESTRLSSTTTPTDITESRRSVWCVPLSISDVVGCLHSICGGVALGQTRSKDNTWSEFRFQFQLMIWLPIIILAIPCIAMTIDHRLTHVNLVEAILSAQWLWLWLFQFLILSHHSFGVFTKSIINGSILYFTIAFTLIQIDENWSREDLNASNSMTYSILSFISYVTLCIYGILMYRLGRAWVIRIITTLRSLRSTPNANRHTPVNITESSEDVGMFPCLRAIGNILFRKPPRIGHSRLDNEMKFLENYLYGILLSVAIFLFLVICRVVLKIYFMYNRNDFSIAIQFWILIGASVARAICLKYLYDATLYAAIFAPSKKIQSQSQLQIQNTIPFGSPFDDMDNQHQENQGLHSHTFVHSHHDHDHDVHAHIFQHDHGHDHGHESQQEMNVDHHSHHFQHIDDDHGNAPNYQPVINQSSYNHDHSHNHCHGSTINSQNNLENDRFHLSNPNPNHEMKRSTASQSSSSDSSKLEVNSKSGFMRKAGVESHPNQVSLHGNSSMSSKVFSAVSVGSYNNSNNYNGSGLTKHTHRNNSSNSSNTKNRSVIEHSHEIRIVGDTHNIHNNNSTNNNNNHTDNCVSGVFVEQCIMSKRTSKTWCSSHQDLQSLLREAGVVDEPANANVATNNSNSNNQAVTTIEQVQTKTRFTRHHRSHASISNSKVSSSSQPIVATKRNVVSSSSCSSTTTTTSSRWKKFSLNNSMSVTDGNSTEEVLSDVVVPPANSNTLSAFQSRGNRLGRRPSNSSSNNNNSNNSNNNNVSQYNVNSNNNGEDSCYWVAPQDLNVSYVPFQHNTIGNNNINSNIINLPRSISRDVTISRVYSTPINININTNNNHHHHHHHNNNNNNNNNPHQTPAMRLELSLPRDSSDEPMVINLEDSGTVSDLSESVVDNNDRFSLESH